MVVSFNFVEVYLTFPKVIVLILKHATSLRLSLLPGPALIQADLDYQQADVDQHIQQYVGASQRPSAELDKAFIMAIEIGSVRLFSCLFNSYKAFISNFRCDKCARKGIVSYNGFWNWGCSRVGAKVAYIKHLVY